MPSCSYQSTKWTVYDRISSQACWLRLHVCRITCERFTVGVCHSGGIHDMTVALPACWGLPMLWRIFLVGDAGMTVRGWHAFAMHRSLGDDCESSIYMSTHALTRGHAIPRPGGRRSTAAPSRLRGRAGRKRGAARCGLGGPSAGARSAGLPPSRSLN